MKLQFWSIGKTHDSYVKEGVEIFTKRISNYYPVEWKIITAGKNSGSISENDLRIKEGETISQMISKDDFLVLLDERGKELNSEGLASFIQKCGNESRKNIIFLIGGAYGVSTTIHERADFTWCLSKLVFPHQIVRLLLAEQIYRACTINRNEKYHHS